MRARAKVLNLTHSNPGLQLRNQQWIPTIRRKALPLEIGATAFGSCRALCDCPRQSTRARVSDSSAGHVHLEGVGVDRLAPSR